MERPLEQRICRYDWYPHGPIHSHRLRCQRTCTGTILRFPPLETEPWVQMTEETHNAAMSGSVGIVMAIGVSAILGWFLILGLLFSIQDLDTTLHSPTGQPVTQIFLDTVGPKGAIVLMVIVIGCMYFCGRVVLICPRDFLLTTHFALACFPSHPTPV